MLRNLRNVLTKSQQTRGCATSVTAKLSDGETKQFDSLQEHALKEQCILVNKDDQVIGSSSKADCHRVHPETQEVKLHRAFSVFLFNTKGEMLVQRRSEHKVSASGQLVNIKANLVKNHHRLHSPIHIQMPAAVTRCMRLKWSARS